MEISILLTHIFTTLYSIACECVEDIVIGSDHEFDVHTVTPEGGRSPLDRTGFWVNKLVIYFLKFFKEISF